MAATPGEQTLLSQLLRLATGQAPGSFGAGQVYALLSGYIRVRDRIDAVELRVATLEQNVADLAAAAATFAGIDAATRLAQLETATADLAALETTRETVDDAQQRAIDDLLARVDRLENPPPPPAG
jgi:hypothetical protein